MLKTAEVPVSHGANGHDFNALRLVGTTVLFALWGALFAIWVATMASYWAVGDHSSAVKAVLAISLLAVLYVAEGLEVSVANLMDRDPGELSNAGAASVLAEIQGKERREFFFANRQVFVALIVTVLAAVLFAFPTITLPGIARFTNAFGVAGWFDVAFSTLTVLWFAQVLPKSLAVCEPSLFFQQGRFLWPVVKAFGRLGLLRPAEVLKEVIVARTSYRNHRILAPSRETLWSQAVRTSGHGIDTMGISLCVHSDGTVDVRQRCLMLFLHGAHGEIRGTIATPMAAAFHGTPEITLLQVSVLPASDRLVSLATVFEGIYEGRESGHTVPLNSWQYRVSMEETESSRVEWVLETRGLPEELWDGAEGAAAGSMAVLLYEVQFSTVTDCYPVGQWNRYATQVSLPCRVLDLSVETVEATLGLRTGSCTVRPSWMEDDVRDVVTDGAFREGNGKVRVLYPLEDATYTISWKAFPFSRLRAREDLANSSSPEACAPMTKHSHDLQGERPWR